MTPIFTLDNQKYGATNADPRIYRRQGGCFNGNDYYQAFISKNEDISVLAKKNVKTGEIIYSEPRLMDHANNVTYNPYTNRAFVKGTKKAFIYDGTTLEFIEEKTFFHATGKISYCPERHTFVLENYYFYDYSLTYTNKYFKAPLSSAGIDSSNMSGQGSSCDDAFIYSLIIEPVTDGYDAFVAVFDWYGNIVTFTTVEIPDKFEPENISIVDGKLYIAACSTQPVATLYEVKF